MTAPALFIVQNFTTVVKVNEKKKIVLLTVCKSLIFSGVRWSKRLLFSIFGSFVSKTAMHESVIM